MPFPLVRELGEVDYLTEEDVIRIHDRVALRTGGLEGLSKRDDLLGAIGRPALAADYQEEADIILIAAYYWHGISTSHGFVDANKRTGFLCAIVFLRQHNIEFSATEYHPGEKVNEWMDKHEFTLERLDGYLREHCFVGQVRPSKLR
ncbi:type II toxin-antitoxin system death-on-curing family toxin [Ruegeria sp. WL0004]|uniref:Type II toxin-antitoxin system death-on-curing family toxin n=1 Tax=Ruegeria marisflavi TaxID=2984152 RepID=A0ABT2WWI7_9RHOB|nr:type II toxin-antitoxin system death-on-curing family toxin [Ruegeria sp. WL0004]MCU9840082.1 type II toxin-antitoxin system death-on-curing family toxin [Ruegeria sp. WL0004]